MGLSLSPYLRHKQPRAAAAALAVLIRFWGVDEEARLRDELNCCGKCVRMIAELPTCSLQLIVAAVLGAGVLMVCASVLVSRPFYAYMVRQTGMHA